jgi:TonB-linked SusC/RagA family outer membrane protein
MKNQRNLMTKMKFFFFMLLLGIYPLFAGNNLSRRIIEEQIIVSRETEDPETKKEEQTFSTDVLQSEDIRITGIVTDENGDPLPGATVSIKNSPRGVMTDLDGNFSIDVRPTDVLLISYLGYNEYSVTIGDKRKFTIQLEPKENELEEVTVVAFGKQKKASVVGAITTVAPKNLKVPSSNLTTAFAGQMAGVIAYQRSGEPGADDVDFYVRGITTFGVNRNPLILIDNIELTKTDLARLQPDDIASFSLMKDATATALYGARGANGVILITTKQGEEGPPKVSFRVEQSLSSPTRKVELSDPITWMQLANEAVLTRNPMGFAPYTDEKIDNTINGTDPLRYPAVDWMDMLIRDNATSSRYNIQLSGGGKAHRYYISGALNHDNGIMNVDKRNNFNNNINNNSYSLRSNIELQVTSTTSMNVRLSGVFDDYSGPLTGGTDLFKNIVKSNTVLFPAYYPATGSNSEVRHIMFGNKENQYYNPYAESVRGYKEKNRSQLLAQVEVQQDLDFLTEGLSVRAMMNLSRLSQFSVSRSYTPYWYELRGINPITGEYMINNTNTGTDWLDYWESADDKETNSTLYVEAMTNYNRTFGDHSVSGLLVTILREALYANTGSLQLSLPHRNLGVSGRFTYGFSDRYYFEFNFGYNGSERFSANHRWGFFPSVGAAWNIANEKFWEPLANTVNLLKLRYSYGLVGNDQIGSDNDRFYYLSEMNMYDGNRTMTFGNRRGSSLSGISVLRDANPNIGWEVSKKANYAVELGLWNDLTLIAEYFRENRTNILMSRSYIPQTMGLTYAVQANVGAAMGHGTDISLEYQKSWSKDFWTSMRANFTYAVSRYDIYDEPAYPGEPWRSRVGKSLSQQWGYIAERLFVDDAETISSPRQEISSYNYMGGDIKYTDVNGDGRITVADAVPIGLPTTPEIVYGFGPSIGYKGVDFSFFFQGLANESFWINGAYTSPFVDNTQMLKVYAEDYWSESNANIYATWPRLSYDRNTNNVGTLDAENNPSFLNTWFMRDGAFLRLKQAELGYTFGGKWRDKLRIGNLRFYLSGTNLLLFSRFKLWDVEMAGNGLGYPIQRVVNAGINITFK